MELYIGGTAQGKKAYVTQVSIPGSRKYGLSGKTSGYSNYLR